MNDEIILCERDGAVATVTLNRPEKRNALSIELRRRLAGTLATLGADQELGVIVLTGAGGAFSSGMDTTQFGGDRANREALVETSLAAFEALGRCPVPVIAAIDGPALAGGFALALNCDLRVAAADATLGFPELPRGIPPSYASARAALTGAVATELCLTGRLLGAREAERLGVVHAVAEGPALAAALELAAGIAAMPASALRATKRRRILERDERWGFLFAAEAAELRAALLGERGAQ